MKNIIHITRPELTEEERAKRLDEIKQATKKLILAVEKERKRKT
jgi:hypothetical protein